MDHDDDLSQLPVAGSAAPPPLDPSGWWIGMGYLPHELDLPDLAHDDPAGDDDQASIHFRAC